jgi:CRP-like cAMP-binding protein
MSHPSTTTTQTALRAVPAFAQLTSAQLDDIAKVCDHRHLASGETLCVAHDFGTDTYVIGAGEISVVVDGVEVARRGPGQVVGDWALFSGGYRSATLRALTAVDAVVVDAREIDSLLMAVPAAAALLGPTSAAHAR